MKIHITLCENINFDIIIDDIIKVGNLYNINTNRAQKYGIITADTNDVNNIDKLKKLSYIQDVEIDNIKSCTFLGK